MGTWYVHTGSSPIDFWPGWSEFVSGTERPRWVGAVGDNFEGRMERDDFDREMAGAEAALRACSIWDGDLRGGIMRVSSVPEFDGATCRLVFAFKQDNNGETFIVSPFRLNYLEEAGCEAFVVKPQLAVERL